jgi:4-amino-4-deoxy-L-arabinose transferase-like glycosyltransferase/membrane-associated phospholipid phosphatase
MDCMSWLESLDASLFRLLNITLSHPALDQVMRIFGVTPPFVCILLGVAVWIAVKGGVRGRLFVAFTVCILLLGETGIGMLKHWIARPRPSYGVPEAHLLVGKGQYDSMPSSHTSIWFALTVLAARFYPKSWKWLLPLACLVGYSRIYLGAHYPGDVLAGAVLGAGYAAAGLRALEWLWIKVAPKWFPLWQQRLPSLLDPKRLRPEHFERPGSLSASPETVTVTWLRAGYLLIAAVTLAKLVYIAMGRIELSEDEAYQWLWSKHLALSYFSKPPLIAYTQFLGTSLWGDTELGVRFFSPVIAAVMGVLILRFMAREVDARAGFWLLVVLQCLPLLAVGSTLMTVDPLLVLFWTAAMILGWRAAQPEGTAAQWAWAGLWLGLGFLSKYTALYQVVCWALFFVLWPPARVHLRKPGPYLALLILACSSLPVLVWNAGHGWITLEHVAGNAQLSRPWKPTLKYGYDFLGSELGLLNPVFLPAALWAGFAFWKRNRHRPLWVFFFCMGMPVFLGHFIYTFHSRVQPNWIAPAVLPMFSLMMVYWRDRWLDGFRWAKDGLVAGIIIGGLTVLVLHETRLVAKVTGQNLPSALDPLRRVRAWSQTARQVRLARQKLKEEGPEVFLIGGHYGLTSLLTFYTPEARAALHSNPLVYYETSETPKNQFYFWPGYTSTRRGQNALFVEEVDRAKPPSKTLEREFKSVTDLGTFEVKYKGQTLHLIQMFACRDLL